MTMERAQYINSVHTCSLCSTVPLQYVLLMLTGLKRKISKCLKPMYIDCMAKISIKHLFICCGYG